MGKTPENIRLTIKFLVTHPNITRTSDRGVFVGKIVIMTVLVSIKNIKTYQNTLKLVIVVTTKMYWDMK